MSFTKQAQNSGTLDIPMGGLGLSSHEKKTLQTFVGSCVAICLYDSVAKVAGMAHVMLPKNNTTDQVPKPEGKFVDVAIKVLLDKLTANGAMRTRLKAKMAGGASVFQTEGNKNVFNIGTRNVDAIRAILGENKIPIVSEDVGEKGGRWVIFDVASQIMTIKDKAKGVTTI
ncbi:chemotaxis protein CheD [Candidatus Nitrosotenuis aquarius]|uniref:chemotaxis protein CheD n=1 Tax=Candidatus Nitrosotenuis aquarius TaxID=1846278 RepID=UPI000C1E63C9|nr:chemotaxis protein CheD [Candidatus Nitrosotenuis aquarius]